MLVLMKNKNESKLKLKLNQDFFIYTIEDVESLYYLLFELVFKVV